RGGACRACRQSGSRRTRPRVQRSGRALSGRSWRNLGEGWTGMKGTDALDRARSMPSRAFRVNSWAWPSGGLRPTHDTRHIGAFIPFVAPTWHERRLLSLQQGSRLRIAIRNAYAVPLRGRHGGARPDPTSAPVTDLINVILLGIIEGITEFLPISSTGHLLIAEHWLGARSDLFNVGIQAGAILAITLVYWKRIWQLLTQWRDPATRDYLAKLTVAFLITCVLGLVVTHYGFKLPETVTPIAWALVIGGFWMIG